MKKNDEERWWAIEQKMERYHGKLEKQYRSTVEPHESGLTRNRLVEMGSAIWGIGTMVLSVAIIALIVLTAFVFLVTLKGDKPIFIPWFVVPSILATPVAIMFTGHLLQRWGRQMFHSKPRGTQRLKR